MIFKPRLIWKGSSTRYAETKVEVVSAFTYCLLPSALAWLNLALLCSDVQNPLCACRYFAASRWNSPEAASASTKRSTRAAVLQHGNAVTNITTVHTFTQGTAVKHGHYCHYKLLELRDHLFRNHSKSCENQIRLHRALLIMQEWKSLMSLTLCLELWLPGRGVTILQIHGLGSAVVPSLWNVQHISTHTQEQHQTLDRLIIGSQMVVSYYPLYLNLICTSLMCTRLMKKTGTWSSIVWALQDKLTVKSRLPLGRQRLSVCPSRCKKRWKDGWRHCEMVKYESVSLLTQCVCCFRASVFALELSSTAGLSNSHTNRSESWRHVSLHPDQSGQT